MIELTSFHQRNNDTSIFLSLALTTKDPLHTGCFAAFDESLKRKSERSFKIQPGLQLG